MTTSPVMISLNLFSQSKGLSEFSRKLMLVAARAFAISPIPRIHCQVVSGQKLDI